MPNDFIDLYRKILADNGQTDDRDDYFITKEMGDIAHKQAPELFTAFPDFAQQWGQIREANAPSLGGELARAAKQGTIGLASTAVGGASLFTGSDYLKRKARALDMMASDPDLAPTIPTLEDIAPGRTGTDKYLSRDALRYAVSKTGQVAPSIAESALVAAAGAALGSAAAPGVGTVAGGVEGVLEKGLVKAAIRKLLADGIEPTVENVVTTAKAIGGFAGGVAAQGASSVLLNSGDVASEGADTGTSIGLGLISAIPDTILPAYVLKKFFPGVAKEAVKDTAKSFLARNAQKLGELAGIPPAEFGQEYFQQAVNVVARNMKEGKDPLTFTDENLRELREAGIAGAFGGLAAAPGVMLAGREAQAPSQELPPATEPPPPVAPLTPPAAPPPPALLPTQRVRAMTPEQQVSRLAELEAKERTADEEAEYQILKATVAPAVPASVAAGDLPLAPTPLTPGLESGAGSAPDLGAGVETPLVPAPLNQAGVSTPTTPVSGDVQDPIQAAFRVAQGSRGAAPAGESQSVPSRTEEEVALKDWATTSGLLQDPANFLKEWEADGRKGGSENQVYFDEANQRMVKRNDLAYDGSWANYFKRLEAHNRLFPDTAYTFLGFTEEGGKLQAVVAQPFVAGRSATAEEVSKDMGSRGVPAGAADQFENAQHVIGDVGPTNVLVDEAGAMRYIDPSIMVKADVLQSAPQAEAAPADVPQNAVQDRPAYDALQQQMREMTAAGQAGTPEFNTIWQQSEDIKNRNAGMPPGEVAGGAVTPEVVSTDYALKAPKPLAESLGSVEETLAYRQERIDNYRKVLKSEIGLDDAQTDRLVSLLRRDADTARFERTLPAVQREKLEVFFDGPLNQRNGPLDDWTQGPDDLNEIAGSTDRQWLADKIVGALGRTGNAPEFHASDAFLSPVLALNRLKEIGGSWADVYKEVIAKTDRMRAGDDSAELNRAYSQSIKKFADDNGLSLPLQDTPLTAPAQREALPTPRTAEQRLNDAGSDLPPISGMSRAAKRAELDAAGITTYNGKPLDAANPAQISAAVGKLRRGELGKEPPPALRTTTEPSNPAVLAQRTKEFQAVMGRLVSNGADVQAMSRELLVQQTGEALQQQIQALTARLQQATTAPQRNALQKAIDIRQQRLSEVAQMRGVTYDPYHIAIAMDDVMNASLDNLVTLLHEAAESLTMRLTPEQQGAVFRAVEKATAQMQAKMQDAAKNTGATVADVPNPSELLAETMAQTLAAEGIPEASSLADAIVRWIKEIYYRVSMAAQKAFGAEPDLTLSLNWYENQLRRELGGDYQYAFSRLLDRFLPQPNANFASKFAGQTGTPGGMADFFDPTTGKNQQPWVEPTSDAALDWNMKFQTSGENPGAEPSGEGIPADEAVARQTAASYNDQIQWLTELHDAIAPQMDMAEFLGLISPGEKTPHEMLDTLKQRSPGVETAQIGGERMTDAMNKWASHQSLQYMKGVQARNLSLSSKMQEAVKEADERFTEHASELNRLEPDVRNAELHEGELKKRVRTIIDGLLKSYKNGLRTSSKLGQMVEAEENLGPRDPLPQFYAQAFVNLMNAQVPLFGYVDAIAALDLPLSEMTPEQIWKAIRDNADTSPKLRELTRNKPLGLTLSVLAQSSARQIDQIQLRKADASTFLDIRKELEGIRNATEAQLREMLKTIDEKNDAKGLRQRIKTAYLKERRNLKRASDRIAQAEDRIAVLEKARPAVAEKLSEMQQAIGGVFTEWAPGNDIEFTVMRRGEDGEFQKATRTLKTNADGSYEDSTGILNDLAQNEQWLKANQDRAGTKEYEQVKHQTRALEMQDVQRAYQAANYGKIMGFIDAFVRPLQAIAKQAGHSVGNRIVQQFNKYEFINRSGAKALTNQSYEWGAAMNSLMKAAGIKDVGQFRAQIYNPVKFWLGVNPGLDQAQAIRGATQVARQHLTTTPPANFNERMEAFLLKDKQIEDELLRTAEQNNVLVWDEKLGELRKAIARGWSTGMRMMDDGVVVTLIHDMEKAGWKLDFDEDARKESKKVVTRSPTFDDLDPANATNPEERGEYYQQLENTDALRAAVQPYFTPLVIQRWLLPFINKPGESVFKHDGQDIPQIDLQNAWAKSGGDVIKWIDNLGQAVGAEATDEASATASFRWEMLDQLQRLFAWEAKMAYEAEQTPDLFDNQGAKLHAMMDARVNDLMPEEHVRFAMHDPTSVRQVLGQIAFHGAFGRNGAALTANLKELEAVSAAKKFAFDGLRSTTIEGRRREAKAKGMDYDELKRAVDHYHDVLELKGEIESAMGVKNIYGPLYDARAGMELLGFMVGQVVDQPKTGALNFLSIGARPFAMHSLSPKVLKATALSYGELAKNSFGGLLHDLGIDLVRQSDYAKETGEVEGKAFRRLPFGTVISGDPGKDGSFQDSLMSRLVVQPLRIFKALQRKGVGPGMAAIPGLGTMQRFSTEGSIANIRGQTFLLQEIINNGIRYFSAHPEDLNNPAFRFDANSLKLKADRGMYDWFRNKTVEYNMGPIEKIVRDAMGRQQSGERTITTEMVEQLAQMNAQELDGASSINTAPAGLAQNQALRVALPLLRWPLWMMHSAHQGLADANGRADFKSMMKGIGRLAAWNLPLGLAFTFLIDEYDDKILKKKNAMPAVSPLAAIPGVGLPLALATTDRGIPTELLNIGQRMIRSGNIYGLGGDMAGAFITPFDPGSGQRAFSLDQRVLIMSQFLNLTQAISNMVSQGGTATWGSVYRPMVASVGGNGMLNSLDVVNNLLGLDNAESRLTTRINAARWVNTAAKELGIDTKSATGFSAPSPMSVWTREMQLASMANNRADFMEAYRKALDAARATVFQDDKVPPQEREKEAMQRVMASWHSRNPFSGLLSTPTAEQKNAMLRVMNDQGQTDVRDAMRYYDAYTQLIKPSVTEQYFNRQMRAAAPPTPEQMRRRAAGMMMAQ